MYFESGMKGILGRVCCRVCMYFELGMKVIAMGGRGVFGVDIEIVGMEW